MNTTIRAQWKIAGVLTSLAVGLAVLFFFSPTRYPFYPRCPLYVLTGLHCPGCGSLRALHSLLHGDLASAIRFNALLILSLPFLAGLCVNSVRGSLGKAALDAGPRPVWIWIFFAMMLTFGVLRNLPFAPFSHLAP